MKFRNTTVENFKGAIRGLRNPLESWSKSDSAIGMDNLYVADTTYLKKIAALHQEKNPREDDYYLSWLYNNGRIEIHDNICSYVFIGPNDLSLMQRMIKAGSSDSKFMRQIFVSVDITAPLYWWKEFDTYKIGTTANSTSTMHKLATTPITKECFEKDDYNRNLAIEEMVTGEGVVSYLIDDLANNLIKDLEKLRVLYNTTKDKRYWKELIRWLPEGWLQTRTVTMNYAVLRNIYFQRKGHKLTEWKQFIEWIAEELPYSNELIMFI